MHPRIPIDQAKIEEFCKKWKIVEFSLFGSVLRDDFRPDSDVDVLVSFANDAHIRLRDISQAERELRSLFGRNVDFVDRRGIEQSDNYIRREDIFSSLYRIL